MRLFTSPLFFAALAITGFVFSAAAIGQTSDQRRMLENLSESQRSALEEQFRQRGGEGVKPEDFEGESGGDRRRSGESDGEDDDESEEALRVRGSDTLVIRFERRSKAEGSLPEHIRRLEGRQVFELSSDGYLELPGIGELPLLGLRAEEIQLRLAAEPQLRNFGITASLLPVDATGVEALEPFGYNVFRDAPTTFAPAVDIPVPADYVVGPGDTLVLQFFGNTNEEHRLTVSREGTIVIPQIGPVEVSGRKFDELRDEVRKRVSEQMIGVRANLSMGALRSLRVFLMGDVEQPGSYTVSSLSTMTNALFVGGGVADSGSLRDIRLFRDGRRVASMDLYDLLLRGDTSSDVRIMPGDVIFVAPVREQVHVAGEVRRPAIYEARKEATVERMIELAGGLTAKAAKDAVQLERILASGQRVLEDLDLNDPEDAQMRLQDGDVLHIRPIVSEYRHAVHLRGHVERRGKQAWRSGMRVTDVVPDKTALRENPDLSYALLMRRDAESDRLTPYSLDLREVFARPGSEVDPVLQPRDELYFFGQDDQRADLLEPVIEDLRDQARYCEPEQVVTIEGRVPFDGNYPLTQRMRISDLIRAGGGLGQDAYALEAEVMRFEIVDDEKREVDRQTVKLAEALGGNEAADIELQPFDIVQIRRMQDWRERRVVQLSGEVRYPGSYTVAKGETLADVVERAGGLTEDAYKRGSVFLREEIREREQEQLERLRRKLRSDLATLSLQSVGGQGQNQGGEAYLAAMEVLGEIEDAEAAGRLVIDLERLLETAEGRDDLRLQDGDELFIPERPETVTVIGEVNFSTSHFYNADMSRDEYIQQSGGANSRADEGEIYIIRANGRVDQAGRGFFRGSPDVEPGDTIVVPLDVTKMRPTVFWSTVAEITSQLAITAAAFNSIGVF